MGGGGGQVISEWQCSISLCEYRPSLFAMGGEGGGGGGNHLQWYLLWGRRQGRYSRRHIDWSSDAILQIWKERSVDLTLERRCRALELEWLR